jgi:hypothetical protein
VWAVLVVIAQPGPQRSCAQLRALVGLRALRPMRKPGQHSPIADDAGMASTRSFGDEAGEIVGLDPDDVHDADAREHARGCPVVDGRGPHAEELRDLADRQELLDRR